MTLYEKLHTANKEELAVILATLYGAYSSRSNKLFDGNPFLGYLSYTAFGVYDAIKDYISKELDKETEDLEIVKILTKNIEDMQSKRKDSIHE